MSQDKKVNCCIAGDPGVAYIRLPKCASLSIIDLMKRTLLVSEVNSEKPVHYEKYLIQKHQSELDIFFSFTFVRNPWDRVHSSFIQKILPLSERTEEKQLDPDFYFKLKSQKILQPLLSISDLAKRDMVGAYEEFVLFLSQKNHTDLEKHWTPLSRLFNPDKVDFIGRLENFSSDISVLYEKIHERYPQYKFLQNNIFPSFINSTSDSVPYIPNSTYEKIAKIYKDDIKLFNYDQFPNIGCNGNDEKINFMSWFRQTYMGKKDMDLKE